MSAKSAKESKTATIKQRRVEIYLPSLETKEEWTKFAAKRGQSLSEMVFYLVHDRIHGLNDEAQRRVAVLDKQNEKLEADLKAARERIEILEALSERIERDLRVYRTQEYTGERMQAPMDARLIHVFRTSKDRDGRHVPINEADLRKAVRVPLKDHAGAKALVEQLVLLEKSSAIKKVPGGWIWNA